MKAWNRPTVPALAGTGVIPRIFDSGSGSIISARPGEGAGTTASIYVCGITPYDATHLGHASTYVAFDTLIRLWLDCGFDVRYVQNSTDIDDPLLARASRDGIDWRDLAESQTDLFRSDMQQLRVIPPDHYVAVTEVIETVADAVLRLEQSGLAYRVESVGAGDDLYFDSAAVLPGWTLGDESGLDRAAMLVFSAERGGDPDRPGKRDPLDPLLWKSERPGDPAWDSVIGRGRPGWHIECSVIALDYLPAPLTVNAGGSDLIFPHHEFSAGHAAALTGHPLAAINAHSGMVAYQGEKMSKSLGNLVLVSRLVDDGVDPRAIRLAILAHRYRTDWEWSETVLAAAVTRLIAWSSWAESERSDEPLTADSDSADDTMARVAAPDDSNSTTGGSHHLDRLRAALADDLDTPQALAIIDDAIVTGVPASALLVDSIDALLGVRL